MVPKLFRLLRNSCQVSWYPNIRPFKYYLSRLNLILFVAGKCTEINRHGQKKSTYSGINITWARVNQN